ncbi:DUF1415 domain-containing protein [Sulfuriflexus mobilis]|uniref:DUF1415 domain-containing protein n=1 Tax=Sulfuriflexus mobilis TaxID=1811807 RepID=UPI000F829C08|nr:DUF1415 domain-containing protein [Sulfuriflexus mobilis]
MDHSLIIDATQRWIQSVVIRHGLCPFAAPVLAKERLQIIVSEAARVEVLVEDLIGALLALGHQPRDEVETSLLVHPYVLTDFETYNDFLDVADAVLNEAGLQGVIQIASFHPDYCFADSEVDAAENYSNRSPFPMLHLLREESIDEAVRQWTGKGRSMDDIPVNNVETLRRMGTTLLEKQLLACKETGINKPPGG